MKKIIIGFILMFLLTGCWNYKELDDYSIVTGIAVDKNKNGYEVSVLIANTIKSNEDASSGLSTIVYSGHGDSIYTAMKDIGLMAPKELYVGHSSILILSEDVAKDGINKITDFFLRYPAVKKDCYIVIARDCKAKDILKINTPLSDIPSQSIYENINSTSELQGMTYKLSFNDMMKFSLKKGDELVISSINIKGNKEDGYSSDNLKTTEPSASLKVNTLGILKDSKLIDWTTKDESRGINIINNQTKEMFISVEYNGGTIILRTEDIDSKTKISLVDNKPKVSISVKSDFSIMEVDSKVDLNDMKSINKIKTLANDKIEEIVKDGINVAQKNKSDVFGIGQMYYKKYPKYFNKNENNWDYIFSNIEFKVKPNITITTKGTAKENIYE